MTQDIGSLPAEALAAVAPPKFVDAPGVEAAPGCVGDWRRWGAAALRGGGEKEDAAADAAIDAAIDADWLLAHALGVEPGVLRLRDAQSIEAARVLCYVGLIERRRQGEPVAYLTGRQGFWKLELEVDSRVLIPRPDTETLVEWALACLDRRSSAVPRIVDLGTGCGALALSLAAERPKASVLATDASAEALDVARANATRLGLVQIEFRAGDWFAPLTDERFDLIISNPPYVADGDAHLDALRHEPRRALVAGPDGLDDLRHLAAGAGAHLVTGGWLLLEHGATQGAQVRALLEAAGFRDVTTRRDLGGNERVSGGSRP